MAFPRYEVGSLAKPQFRLKSSVVIISALLGAGSAHATVSIDTGLPDLTVDWTNTLGYTGGIRTQAQRQYILNSTAGGSDLKFGQGNINTSQFNVLSELVIKYQNNWGFRLSGNAWYDPAYSNSSADVNPLLGASGYANNRFSGYEKHYYEGPGAQLLDAYAFGKFYAGDVPVNVKLGRHTEYWGEALFSNTYAVSYSQSPVDGITGASNPGAQVKTLFLPLNHLSMQAQITPDISVGGQYFFEWEPTRLPVGGTYFGVADFLYKGPNQLPLGGGVALPQVGAHEPRDFGNFGLNTQWNFAPLATKFGFFYRKFDDYMPWAAPEVTTSGYQLVYPRNTQLFGVTASREIMGASIGAELSYRKNTALSPSGINPANGLGPSGNTWNAVLNSIWLLDKTRFYDTGTAILELTFNHLQSVTSNSQYFNGVGYGTCSYKWDGCATRNYVGIAYQFDPQWLQVFPSVDIDLPIYVNYGLYGNAANNAGGFQGAITYSAGVNFLYKGKYSATLSYEGFNARSHNQGAVVLANGNVAYNDKGWVFLTLKAAF